MKNFPTKDTNKYAYPQSSTVFIVKVRNRLNTRLIQKDPKKWVKFALVKSSADLVKERLRQSSMKLQKLQTCFVNGKTISKVRKRTFMRRNKIVCKMSKSKKMLVIKWKKKFIVLKDKREKIRLKAK